MLNPIVSSYDVRESLRSSSDQWSPDRRETYLIRKDVVRPLSVDPWVWRRVRPRGLSEFEAFKSLARAQAAGRSVVDSSVVAVVDRVPVPGAVSAAEPSTADPTWTLLGWDVADGETSGLSNCGFRNAREAGYLRRKWARAVNEWGLFDSDVAAAEFCREFCASCGKPLTIWSTSTASTRGRA